MQQHQQYATAIAAQAQRNQNTMPPGISPSLPPSLPPGLPSGLPPGISADAAYYAAFNNIRQQPLQSPPPTARNNAMRPNSPLVTDDMKQTLQVNIYLKISFMYIY